MLKFNRYVLMEQEARKNTHAETTETGKKMTDILVLDSHNYTEIDMAKNNEVRPGILKITQALLQNEEKDEDESDDGSSDDDSSADYCNTKNSQTLLQRCDYNGGVNSNLPDTFQTSHLLFYERFKAYQDYMLGDCKPSELKAFIADYLEKVVEPCGWMAVWSTDVFDVLVEVCDVDLKDLKACVGLVLPMKCDIRDLELNEEAMKSLLEATQHKIPLQELKVVFEQSGDFDQTALALEHLSFFYKHIWRQWDEEDEDDDFDYFVRCVEPRLRLYYDILEDRVPAGLVAEYHSILEECFDCFQQFSVLRSSLSTDSDSELDNVSMVEGLKLYDQLEMLKRKLHIIENPLLRYVLGYKGNTREHCVQSRGLRASGMKMCHVVTASCTTLQLQSLLSDKLLPLCSSEEIEIQFHKDPISAVNSCHQGDVVILLPGIYVVNSSIFLPDSITIEGFGLPDDVVIEKKNKGDYFVESTGANVRLSNIKFIQHDAIEGILCVRQGSLNMENCVLQCETTGVILQTSAHLTMNMCDLFGSKGAGVEIYPSSVCNLVGNGIHHCKDGVLIKDFANDPDSMPSITMKNNVIHNNEGYGVIVVKPSSGEHRVPLEGSEVSNLSNTGSTHVQHQSAENKNSTDSGVATTSEKKWQFNRQLSRNKEASCTQVVQNLMEHPIFVSIQGNQFRRNGMGDFGTFFY